MRICGKQRRVAIGSFVFAFLIFLVGCGGGDGGGTATTPTPPTPSEGTAPAISNLQYSPNRGIASAGQTTQTVSGTFNFYDPDGDLASMTIQTSVENATPLTSSGTAGTIAVTVQVSLLTPGQFPFDLWITDSKGNKSNHLTGSFTVGQQVTGTGTYVQNVAGQTFNINSCTVAGSIAIGEHRIDSIEYHPTYRCIPVKFTTTGPDGQALTCTTIVLAPRLCGPTADPVDFAKDPSWACVTPDDDKYEIDFRVNGAFNINATIY